MFRKILAVVLLTFALLQTTGCLIAPYSGDPIQRNQQLLYNSENLRAIQGEWERFWLLDQPSHLTPYRTHGGII